MRICAWEYVVDAINLWFETNQSDKTGSGSRSEMDTVTTAFVCIQFMWHPSPPPRDVDSWAVARQKNPLAVTMRGLRRVDFFCARRFAQCTIAHTIDSRSTKNTVLSATYAHSHTAPLNEYGLGRETVTNAHKSKLQHKTNKFAREGAKQWWG